MKRARERGQALVEFAVVLPVFMLLVAAMIQFGVILWGQNTLNQVVRDAGRFAATTCSVSDAENRVADLANASGGPWQLDVSSVSVTYSGAPCPPEDNQEQAWVKVAASYDVAIFFPFVPGNGRISSSTDFRVEPAP